MWNQDLYINYSDFQKIAPDIDFSQFNFQGFANPRAYHAMEAETFSMALLIDWRHKDNSPRLGNPKLRVGFAYSSGFYTPHQFVRSSRTPYDTVQVIVGGETTPYPRDSVYTESYRFDNWSRRLRMHASILWQTNPEKRWSLFSGVGLGFGVSIYSEIEHYFSSSYSIETQTSPNQSLFQGYFLNEPSGYIANSGSLSQGARWIDANIFVPIGLDFRLSKKENLFKKMHLIAEITPMLYMNKVPGIRMKVNGTLGANFGLRYNF